MMEPVAWDETAPSREYVLMLREEIDAQRVRLSDAEARIRELERERDVWKAKSGGIAVQPVLDSLHAAEARAEAAEALLKEAREALELFTKYAQDDCFKGSTKWELVECDRPGGAWFGAEDFRAARAIHHKIGVKDA